MVAPNPKALDICNEMCNFLDHRSHRQFVNNNIINAISHDKSACIKSESTGCLYSILLVITTPIYHHCHRYTYRTE